MLTLAGIADDYIPFFAIGCGFVIAVTWLLSHTIVSVNRDRQREQTRREVAAYVSEGTMTAETASMILNTRAGKPWEEQVATLVGEGAIDSDEAEKLLRAGPKSGPVHQGVAAARA